MKNISIGDKVKVRGWTANNLRYGYIREIIKNKNGITTYTIYFPEIGKEGSGWLESDLFISF